MAPSAARLDVFQHLFASIADEMGVALQRASFSPNIKERRDFSCALFDARGRMIAQAAHIPIHLGSMPLCVAAVTSALELAPGDAVLLNDPYRGGTHLPDITLVTPIFLGRAKQPAFFAANRAHHADVGGAHPGSMAPADDVHAEGLRIPPIKLIEAGRLRRDVLELVLANLRVPREREGDLLAQSAANHLGVRRIEAMAREHGRAQLAARASDLLEWTARRSAELFLSLPKRRVTFEDALDPLRGSSRPLAIRVSLQRKGARRGAKLVVDFRASDAQVGDGLNATRAVTVSAVYYALRVLLASDTPTNEGVLRNVEILTRRGSIVDALYPAPVAAGNVETSQRIVDVLFGALSKLLPGRMPAASSGTMSNLSFGGVDAAGSAFTYYETIAGGAGASRGADGAHALHTHMTNTRNTPIEDFEQRFPVRVTRYSVRRGSGGAGRRRGGDGIDKELEFLAPAQVAWIADRTSRGPWGRAGGGAGACSRAKLTHRDGSTTQLAGRTTFSVRAGERLTLATPGGGGVGRARAT